MQNGRKPGGIDLLSVENQKARRAIDTLKQAFQQAPLLHHYNPSFPTRVECNASNGASAAVISQRDPKEAHPMWHPITF